MLSLRVFALLPAFGCQGASEQRPQPAASIEVRDGAGAVVARVQPGRPCRATVDGVELLVGARPFVAQVGTDVWTGEDAANGTTLKKNGRVVARIHARQLFDDQGIPLIRVLESGAIVDRANAVVRTATPSATGITVGDLTVGGTTNVVLAAMLSAREALPEVRALAACHFLLNES